MADCVELGCAGADDPYDPLRAWGKDGPIGP